MVAPLLVIVSEEDPVARPVAARWGTLPSTGLVVDGAPVRQISSGVLCLRRPGRHIHDERLDRRLPAELRESSPTLVFPSIHRSEQNVACLTVHPLGNLGPRAEVGGTGRTVVPTDPLRMTAALRLLAEGGRTVGLSATFESTHHGPELGLPAFFAEIGYGGLPEPPAEAVRVLADVIPRISAEPGDRIAMGVGGGHYAPHFTDLALRRRWAFGHLISRHALGELDRPTARAAFLATPGAEGLLYARAEDASVPSLEGLGPRLRDGAAERRGDPKATSPGGPPASGT